MPTTRPGLLGAGLATLATLVDLVLPADCAGCGSAAGLAGLCPACAPALAAAPAPTRPTPPPPGLPPCLAGGPYEGVLREAILSYKERGRRGLAAPLGDALAAVVRAGTGAPPNGAGGFALALVPVPATAAAIRARHGDHMLALARRAARRLRGAGWSVVVVTPVRALPKPDSAHLDRAARAQAALASFVVRPARAAGLGALADAGGAIVVVDDVLTTGSTVAAVARRLFAAGAPVAFAATLAATRLRHDGDPARGFGAGSGDSAGLILVGRDDADGADELASRSRGSAAPGPVGCHTPRTNGRGGQ